MKLNIAEKLTLAAASCIGVALFIIAGSSASGGGGPGFSSQNNPGMQGSQFGQSTANSTGPQPAAVGPGFGPGNNPGVEGSAYGRSIANDASSGRSGGQDASSHSSSAGGKEEVVDTDTDNGKGKARSEKERETNHASPKNKGKHLGQEKAGNTGKPSIISGPGIREDSILYTGITPIPSATVSKGVNPVPSATVSSRPSFTPGVSPIPSATVSRGVNPVPSATMSPRP